MSNESAVRNNIWKWLVLLLIAVVSFYVTTPVQEKLRFGLDLKGGTSFTLGVDTDKLAESIIAENPDITNKTGAVETKIDEILKDCDSRIIEVIRRRVDAMGTNEPVIQGMKDHRLLVQLPGVDEEVRKAAKASLQSAAYLEFRLTHAKNDQLVAKLLSKDVAPEGYVKKGSGYARAENWKEVSKTPGYAARLAAFEVPDPRFVFMLEDNGDGATPIRRSLASTLSLQPSSATRPRASSPSASASTPRVRRSSRRSRATTRPAVPRTRRAAAVSSRSSSTTSSFPLL